MAEHYHRIAPGGRFWIERPALLDRLDQAAAYTLTLLPAPAGSGKSTLLQQWRAARPQWQIATLSLTRRDADPVRFFSRLDAAVREVVPDFEGLSYNDLSAEAALPAAVLVDALLQALAEVRGPFFLLIDEFQFAGDPLIHAVLSGVLQGSPASLHWVIACRGQPQLALSRLQLEDRVQSIDRTEMCFSAAELDALCAHYCPALAPGQRQRLLVLTEGWAAGIKLALLAQAPAGPLRFSDQPALLDYFAEVVIHDLPPAVHRFLLHTAALERFCEPLCDALLDGPGSSAPVLAYLQSRELFLHPVEDHPGWMRYHTLFQEFLLARLQAGAPETLDQLHRRAACWWRDHADEESALQHARQVADQHFFEQMLTQCCYLWHQRGDYTRIMHWLLALPEIQVVPNTDLCGPLIGALILSRRFNQARYYIDASLAVPPAERQGRFADAWTPAFLENMLLFFQRDCHFRIDDDQAVLLASTGQHDVRAFSLAIIAYHYLMHAEFDTALHYAQRAKDILSRLGYRYLESYADLSLVLCDRNRGRMLHATQSVHEMFRRYQPDAPGPAWVNAGTAMMVLHYEMNQLDQARHLGDSLLPRVSSSCATEVIAAAYLNMSRLFDLAGQTGRAQRLLQHLERILTLGNYDRVVSQLVHEKMRQAFVAGDHHRMEQVMTEYRLLPRLQAGEWQAAGDYDENRERAGMAVVLWLWSRQDYDRADGVLAARAGMLRRQGANARALVADACRVAGSWRRGRPGAARQHLKALVARYGLEALNRTAFDEAPGLALVVAEAHRLGEVTLPDIYLQMFASLLPSEQAPAAAPVTAALTAREAEILTLLRDGLSNREISETSGVAVTTIKWHMKNIFAKLGVSSRAEAIVWLARHGQP